MKDVGESTSQIFNKAARIFLNSRDQQQLYWHDVYNHDSYKYLQIVTNNHLCGLAV